MHVNLQDKEVISVCDFILMLFCKANAVPCIGSADNGQNCQKIVP